MVAASVSQFVIHIIDYKTCEFLFYIIFSTVIGIVVIFAGLVKIWIFQKVFLKLDLSNKQRLIKKAVMKNSTYEHTLSDKFFDDEEDEEIGKGFPSTGKGIL